jgi:hypothetical protein
MSLNFSAENMVEKIEKLYGELLKGRLDESSPYKK